MNQTRTLYAGFTALTLTLAACSTAPRPEAFEALEPAPGVDLTAPRSPSHPSSLATPAKPQAGDDTRPVSAGRTLFQVGGTGSNDRDFDIGNGALSGALGYTVADQFELGVRQQLGFTLRANADDTWNGATQGVADFYLINGTIAPYIGASAGWIYGDTLAEDVLLGPEAGVKFFLQPDAFLDLRAQYLFLLDAKDDFNDAFETGSWFYGLNMGLTF